MIILRKKILRGNGGTVNPRPVYHGVLDFWILRTLVSSLFDSLIKEFNEICVHLLAHPGLLKRAHNIQKSNTPWYTGRGFTVKSGN